MLLLLLEVCNGDWGHGPTQEFKKGTSPIMIATDVAARGLGEWCICSPLIMSISHAGQYRCERQGGGPC